MLLCHFRRMLLLVSTELVGVSSCLVLLSIICFARIFDSSKKESGRKRRFSLAFVFSFRTLCSVVVLCCDLSRVESRENESGTSPT
jgi:hypothetical protein